MPNLPSRSALRRDHYQELTDRIIAALEAGVAPWRRPWDPNASSGSNMPVNVATGHRYRGVSLFVLGMSYIRGRPAAERQSGRSIDQRRVIGASLRHASLERALDDPARPDRARADTGLSAISAA